MGARLKVNIIYAKKNDLVELCEFRQSVPSLLREFPQNEASDRLKITRRRWFAYFEGEL